MEGFTISCDAVTEANGTYHKHPETESVFVRYDGAIVVGVAFIDERQHGVIGRVVHNSIEAIMRTMLPVKSLQDVTDDTLWRYYVTHPPLIPRSCVAVYEDARSIGICYKLRLRPIPRMPTEDLSHKLIDVIINLTSQKSSPAPSPPRKARMRHDPLPHRSQTG